VRLVDTGTASFGVSCCVWEAALALERGATAEEGAAIARNLAESIGNVFVVQALDLVRAGGHLTAEVTEKEESDSIPVLSLIDGEVRPVGQARDLDEAAAVMADFVTLSGEALKVAVGVADQGAMPLRMALEAELEGAPQVCEVIRYRIGPSVGAHTGPGTAGAFFYPEPA
jgi:fatty acid-binding protein DegV